MDFEVKIVSLAEVSKHENADSLDIARIAGYQCVVRRNQFRTGDLAVYIPEGSIIPQELLEETGLWDPENNKGKLAGPRGNRLKAVRLRGVVSQGLLVPAPQGFGAGDDVAEHYGITKYVPEVPADMRGQVTPAAGITPAYDIEDLLKWPDVIREGSDVIYTKKLHGTLACYGHIPGLEDPALINGNVIVASKGLTGRMSFKDSPENRNNLYVRTFTEQLLNTGA